MKEINSFEFNRLAMVWHAAPHGEAAHKAMQEAAHKAMQELLAYVNTWGAEQAEHSYTRGRQEALSDYKDIVDAARAKVIELQAHLVAKDTAIANLSQLEVMRTPSEAYKKLAEDVQRKKAVDKMILDSMYCNGHPTKEGVLIFVSEEELLAAGHRILRQVSRAQHGDTQ